ncbi:MAG: flagellar biosynthetic protein FliR [Phycisphaerales bacterium]|nr:flagellar biosynthetic protein FliR [Phycisphaerales bacterium]
MTSLVDILPHVTPFAAILARVAGLFLFTPILSSVLLPIPVRAMVVVMLTAALYPMADVSQLLDARLDVMELAPLMATESLIGLSLGLLASVPLMLVQVAGVVMGQQMGLSLGQAFNPALDIEAENIGQFLFFMGIASFLAMGGLEIVFSALVTTFTLVPAGAFALNEAPLDVLTGLLESGMDLALRVSLPVLAIIFVETVAVGVLMKTVPGLNILSFGFPIRILAGLAAFIAGLTMISVALENEITVALDAMQDWAWSLAR